MIIFDGIGIAGFRSFGNDMQYLPNLGKVNIMIGKNNSGKSNILKFINYLPGIISPDTTRHLDINYDINKNEKVRNIRYSVQIKKDSIYNKFLFKALNKISMNIKPNELNNSIWVPYIISNIGHVETELDTSDKLFKQINHNKTKQIMDLYYGFNYRKKHEDLLRLYNLEKILNIKRNRSIIIPAYRKITNSKEQQSFDGAGLIAKLANFQNPRPEKKYEKNKFELINSFLRSILKKNDATLYIPHIEMKLYVKMDNKTLPIENIGTGVHQLIIIATAVTLNDNLVFCIEEPELYLYPEIQKLFIKYILENTNNQYFISTHSNAIFDISGVNVYHCYLKNGYTIIKPVFNMSDKYNILDELGYKASDLLQSNCIIWVEGPSDRIYIDKWISDVDKSLIEGIHYSIMYYGGRLLSHLTIDNEINDFIKLKKLNRNIAMVIDSDKESENIELNKTKNRIIKEISEDNGYIWVTKGREIENYIDEINLHKAIIDIYGEKVIPLKYSQYNKITNYKDDNNKNRKCDKVRLAKKITEKPTNYKVLNLEEKIKELIDFINKSNLK